MTEAEEVQNRFEALELAIKVYGDTLTARQLVAKAEVFADFMSRHRPSRP